MKDKKLVCVGEALWDIFDSNKRLGGAPTNVAVNWQTLGGKGFVVTAVGDDKLGEELVQEIDKAGLNHAFIQINPNKETGIVTVKLDEKGIPEYDIVENVAYDFIEDKPELEELVKSADVIVFGTLAQRSEVSRNTIQNLVNICGGIKVYDINLRGWGEYTFDVVKKSFELANVLKINDEELDIVADKFGLESTGEEERVVELCDRFIFDVVALTRGEKGSLVYKGKEFSHTINEAVSGVDTVGAGDAYTAAMIAKFVDGGNAEEISEFASQYTSDLLKARK